MLPKSLASDLSTTLKKMETVSATMTRSSRTSITPTTLTLTMETRMTWRETSKMELISDEWVETKVLATSTEEIYHKNVSLQMTTFISSELNLNEKDAMV